MLDDGERWIQIPPCGPRVHSFKKRNKLKDTAAEGLKRAGAFFIYFRISAAACATKMHSS
jgi:hypothetical protein